MKKSLFMLLILLFSTIQAQNLKFSTEDIILNSRTTLATKSLEKLAWLPDQTSYSYIENQGDKYSLVKATRAGKKTELVSLEKLNSELIEFDLKAPAKFPVYSWLDDNTFGFWLSNSLFNYNTATETLERINILPEDATDIKLAKDNKTAAYILNNDLYVKKADSSAIRITFNGASDYTYGVAVSRNEFGIKDGIFWSETGRFLAFYHEDLRQETDYPLLNIETIPATISNIKYPCAGQKSSKITIGIYDVDSSRTTWLDTKGEEDQYLTSVTWDPNENYMYVGLLNRDQNHLKLAKYDINDGEMKSVLFEEKNPKFVEPEDELKFVPASPDKFIWFSKRDGWKHAYLYTTEGKLISQLTKGQWDIIDFLGFDAASETIAFTNTEVSPLERHLYRVNIASGEKTKLTSESGTHSLKMHKSGYYFIDEFSSITTPKKTTLLNYKGETESILHESPNPLVKFNLGEVKLSSIKADDNTVLYTSTIYPPDFNPELKYPVIVYTYGGPHDQLVVNKWVEGKYGLWFYRMAQEGYIIFTLDNRGSANRGLEFEQATFGKLGTVEVKDQLAGVKYLQSLSYVDTSRIGVYGWSYGGFMATSLMLKANNIFKVGVAGGAVIDWSHYEIMYTERYMDTPQTNKKGYDESNLLNYVQNLKGKLLLVQGTDDPVVPWQQTLRFAKKAMNQNKPLDYFPYIGYGHHVYGTDAVHLYNKITNYFLDNL